MYIAEGIPAPSRQGLSGRLRLGHVYLQSLLVILYLHHQAPLAVFPVQRPVDGVVRLDGELAGVEEGDLLGDEVPGEDGVDRVGKLRQGGQILDEHHLELSVVSDHGPLGQTHHPGHGGVVGDGAEDVVPLEGLAVGTLNLRFNKLINTSSRILTIVGRLMFLSILNSEKASAKF